MKYYLSVDIGASSGRHIISWIEDGKIKMEEMYRFENGMKKKNGHLCWNVEQLFQDILDGMKKCAETGKTPSCMGIDTWAVDFVLLDKEGNVIGDSVGYRDQRTDGMDEEVYKLIPEKDLYARTGIQKQIFNTIYQLMAVKLQNGDDMSRAEKMLLIPDYFNYKLTGVAATEYTNASTTQLVSPITKDWDFELIQILGYNKNIFGKITMPGTFVGKLSAEIKDYVGYDLDVIQIASHDTASAVAAVPSTADSFAYISSGTWSLLGTEIMEANCSEASQAANFTNEGGYEYRFRYLKNIMGLWMIQSVRHEWDDKYSFAEICTEAEKEDNFTSRVEVTDHSFLAPDSMIKAVQDYCRNSNQPVPETVGQISAVIYHSLADGYGKAIKELEAITGKTFSQIHVVGGGSNADYLNKLTAESTGKKVFCGPGEATAIGNAMVLMLKSGDFNSLTEAREVVYKSFDIKCFN